MTLVIDASVALKWVLNEEGSDRAGALLGADVLIAPDFLVVECANVLSLKARRGDFSLEVMRQALGFVSAHRIKLLLTSPLVERAAVLGAELNHSVYDCLYLALAEAEDAELVTADARFAGKVQNSAIYGPRIRLL